MFIWTAHFIHLGTKKRIELSIKENEVGGLEMTMKRVIFISCIDSGLTYI